MAVVLVVFYLKTNTNKCLIPGPRFVRKTIQIQMAITAYLISKLHVPEQSEG